MAGDRAGDGAGARRTPYLSQVPLEQARERWFAAVRAAGGLGLMPPERIDTAGALGRVLAEPAFARFSSPSYHACAMDGFAVRAADTFGAGEGSPRVLAVPGAARYVDTGDPLPPGCDAVIMIEDVHIGGTAGAIEILAPAAPWQHVRPIGEDVAAGEMLLPSGWRLRGSDLAVLTAAGLSRIEVRRRPRVVVVPTGDEIVALGDFGERQPAAGEIVESNSLLVRGVAAECGADAAVTPVVGDRPAEIRATVLDALDRADVVVLSAGSSAGSEDFAAGVLGEVGEVLVHGVATRPGKPVILAVSGGKPVLGMPGYPVSAWLCLDNFLRPLLAAMLGTAPEARERVRARLTRRLASPLGVREYLRVRLGRVGGEFVAAPLARGAGVLSSLVRADGLVVVPPGLQGYEAGAVVETELLRPRDEVERAVVAIGSHDLALDVLADLFRARHPGCSLASINAGSLGGLQALARGEAHIAGSHLLDEASGEYNVSYVRRMLPGLRVALFCLALRQQGLLVAPGNPRGIAAVEDLAGRGLRLINRQRGAGTRVLLDFLLRQAGIDPAAIKGYERVVYTHLAVAAEVAAGGADAGLGILAAARAAGLDFVPLASEPYELVIPARSWEDPLVQELLDVARGEDFRRVMNGLGGYDTSVSGEVRWIEAAEGGAEGASQ
ncbi:MAG: molybdopterin biosynthesis protein [Bacillota bacterium]|nr:molybdopterin biosynthesis protein [Bacillota bacterium]